MDDLRRWVASRSTWPTDLTHPGLEPSAIFAVDNASDDAGTENRVPRTYRTTTMGMTPDTTDPHPAPPAIGAVPAAHGRHGELPRHVAVLRWSAIRAWLWSYVSRSLARLNAIYIVAGCGTYGGSEPGSHNDDRDPHLIA